MSLQQHRTYWQNRYNEYKLELNDPDLDSQRIVQIQLEMETIEQSFPEFGSIHAERACKTCDDGICTSGCLK